MSEIFKNLALAGDTWVLYLLVIASVTSIAVVIGRYRTFSKSKGDVVAIRKGLRECLERADVVGASALVKDSPLVEAKIAMEGLANLSKGSASVEEAMASQWMVEKLELEKHLNILGTLGNNAPFVGLFGTVLGIIKAFNDLALTGQSGVAVVMSGVSSALIATAFGILVAIPAVMANNYFVTRLKQIQSNSQSLSHILLTYLKQERS